MHINKEYLHHLQTLIKDAPWRCNDDTLQGLLDYTQLIINNYEKVSKDYAELLTQLQQTDMRRNEPF